MREIKRWRRVGQWGIKPLICSLVVVTAVAGCKQPTEGGTASGGNGTGGSNGTDASSVGKAAAYTGDDILLGEYGSLTGSTATFGISSDNGMQMAVDEVNGAGGVLGKKVRVQKEDDGGKSEQVGSVIKKLINQDNVLAIVGEVASSRSIAAAPICQAAGVPMITPASTNPTVTTIGDDIFRTCFTDTFQGAVGARFAGKNLKAKTAAVLTDVANDYSKGLGAAFIEEFQKNGGKIVAQESYSEHDTDFHAQLTRIKSTNPDVIFIPGYYTEAATIAVQARSLGIQQPLLGGDGWDSRELIKIGKSALQNCYFSDHYSPDSPDPKVKQFVTTYQKRFGEIPDAMAPLAYDATHLLLDAIKRAGSLDRDKIRDAIANTKNYPGVTGNISIDKDRNAVKPITILQVKGDKFTAFTTIKP
ncbi:MAG: ABC transporter substrate-binding protein [Abitibacteriaceae bacterium]|nr:ABC transporter substrate-binding protein [Abditibacteriaceae bacterium]